MARNHSVDVQPLTSHNKPFVPAHQEIHPKARQIIESPGAPPKAAHAPAEFQEETCLQSQPKGMCAGVGEEERQIPKAQNIIPCPGEVHLPHPAMHHLFARTLGEAR